MHRNWSINVQLSTFFSIYGAESKLSNCKQHDKRSINLLQVQEAKIRQNWNRKICEFHFFTTCISMKPIPSRRPHILATSLHLTHMNWTLTRIWKQKNATGANPKVCTTSLRMSKDKWKRNNVIDSSAWLIWQEILIITTVCH